LKHLEYNYVDFRKNYKCKHSLGIALLQKKVDCPPEAKNVPIGERRQRGRPKRQIRTSSQIFDFLVLFCREFNADSYETFFNNFG